MFCFCKYFINLLWILNLMNKLTLSLLFAKHFCELVNSKLSNVSMIEAISSISINFQRSVQAPRPRRSHRYYRWSSRREHTCNKCIRSACRPGDSSEWRKLQSEFCGRVPQALKGPQRPFKRDTINQQFSKNNPKFDPTSQFLTMFKKTSHKTVKNFL